MLPAFLRSFPSEHSIAGRTRPYFNHAVAFKKNFSAAQRFRQLVAVGLNVFFFPGEMVTGCDCLSDSGVSTMTNEQWASLHFGDECYGANQGYFLLSRAVRDTFGKDFFNLQSAGRPNAFLFHQARPAENALFYCLSSLGSNLLIPSNGFFDTTEANIQANRLSALNFLSPELKKENSRHCFKGNIDLERFAIFMGKNYRRVPLIYLTITNNPGGGQPVSLDNIKSVSRIALRYRVPLFFDACRFAENAWFIKKNEPGYSRKSIAAIVREMFFYADGFTISFKKDGLANMGGGLFLKDGGLFIRKYAQLPNLLLDYQVRTEGNPSYGGISGRDLMTIVYGLRTVIRSDYLHHRVAQTRFLGEYMDQLGLPVLLPIGGHAVYLDVDRFFADTRLKPEDFGGISFTALLLSLYGHRACELGNFAFGSYDSHRRRHFFPQFNYVRFALPRLRYEDNDLRSMAEAVKAIYDHRHQIRGVKVVSGLDATLRHFKARFAFRA